MSSSILLLGLLIIMGNSAVLIDLNIKSKRGAELVLSSCNKDSVIDFSFSSSSTMTVLYVIYIVQSRCKLSIVFGYQWR
jgi:hypothetical protein